MLKPEMLTGTPSKNAFNLTNIADLTARLNAAGRSGNVDEAMRLAGRLQGVGTAKEGFVAHLLGLGDAPTVDTNELKIWLSGRSPQLQENVERAFGTKGSPAAVEMRDQLMQRFNELRSQGYGTDIPPEAFQHVMHHWLFDSALGAETTHAALYRAQQRAQANVPFSANVGGAVAGGVAGNVATPENATPEERARNIALGAGAGLLGTSALTRALERRRLAPEAGGGVRPPDTGFRAPVTPDDLNVRTISQEEARQLVGPAYDPSTRTTQRPPAPGEEPRRLEDVQSNPHLLREPGPGETPMTMDERLAHQDTLEQRYQANTERLAAIDEQLRNPTARPERPPWAAGFTNDQVATMAAKVGRSPYEPLWWEKAGLEAGSGEVREMVNEGGVERGRFDATRTSTPAELRAEQRALQQDQLHLEAAGEQQATAPDNAQFAKPPERAAGALPFGEGGAADPGAQLAQEVVTSKGRATSRRKPGHGDAR